jgi:hypothetical protein
MDTLGAILREIGGRQTEGLIIFIRGGKEHCISYIYRMYLEEASANGLNVLLGQMWRGSIADA